MDLGLSDRACVITGGSRGIRLAIAEPGAGNVVGAAWSADSGAVPSIF